MNQTKIYASPIYHRKVHGSRSICILLWKQSILSGVGRLLPLPPPNFHAEGLIKSVEATAIKYTFFEWPGQSGN